MNGTLGKNGIEGSKKGCPCFFDPDGTKTGLVSKNECACCPEGYLPCGYPKVDSKTTYTAF